MKSSEKEKKNIFGTNRLQKHAHHTGPFLGNASDCMAVGGGFSEGLQTSCVMMDHPYQLMGILSPEGRVIVVNKIALEFAGVIEPDVSGKLFWECPWWTHSQEIQKRLKVAVAQAAAGDPVRFETTNLDKNGYIRHIDFSLSPVFDERGEVQYLVPEGLDITETKKREEASGEGEKRNRDFAETASDATFIMNWNMFVECNQKTLDVFRCKRKQIIGCRIIDFISLEQPDGIDCRRLIMEQIEAALRGRPRSFALMFSRFDGESFEAELSFIRIELSTGPYILGRLRDVASQPCLKKREAVSIESFRSPESRVSP